METTKGTLNMSVKEIDRVSIMERIIERRMTIREGALRLKLTARQVKRIKKKYISLGIAGLISKKRGKLSNRGHSSQLKENVLELLASTYYDFGPTLASEKLKELHEIKINRETLRKWGLESGLWKAKRRKVPKIHQTRTRRSCFGELIQIDGSHHAWFEDRGPTCCLLVFIDDATSCLVGLRFEPGETTAGYFRLAKSYFNQYGLPQAFYSDRDSIFRVNRPESVNETETQFERAMKELDIELICARSPQAKGRVEKANGTLQRRLVKELRLRGINTIEEANRYLPEFIEKYNQKFAVEAADPTDIHCKTLPDIKKLNRILSFRHIRTLTKNLELSYQNRIYQLNVQGTGLGLRHAKVEVCESLTGEITLFYRDRILSCVSREKNKKAPAVLSAKELEAKPKKVSQNAPHKPGAQHPWLNGGFAIQRYTDLLKKQTNRSYPPGSFVVTPPVEGAVTTEACG